MARKQTGSLIVGSLLGLAIFAPAAAQNVVESGATLKAEQQVKLRAFPPSQQFLFFVGSPGGEKGDVKRGDTVRVESVSRVKVPTGEDVWTKVKTENGATGWVYYGRDKDSTNFKQVK
jgi:hypothetical protein